MTTTLKYKTQLVVPPSIQKRAGIKVGDQVEFKVSGGIINIIPKLPLADDEYTTAQRGVIDARLAEAKKGPYFGPFDNAETMVEHMKGELKKRATTKKHNRPIQ